MAPRASIGSFTVDDEVEAMFSLLVATYNPEKSSGLGSLTIGRLIRGITARLVREGLITTEQLVEDGVQERDYVGWDTKMHVD